MNSDKFDYNRYNRLFKLSRTNKKKIIRSFVYKRKTTETNAIGYQIRQESFQDFSSKRESRKKETLKEKTKGDFTFCAPDKSSPLVADSGQCVDLFLLLDTILRPERSSPPSFSLSLSLPASATTVQRFIDAIPSPLYRANIHKAISRTMLASYVGTDPEEISFFRSCSALYSRLQR